MDRITSELPITAAAAAIMAAMVLVGGMAVEPSPLARVPSGHTAGWTTGEGIVCLDAPVSAPSTPDFAGQATLCDAGGDLRVELRVNSLSPGKIYTAWLGFVDRPTSCEEPSCESDDLTGVISVILLDARRIGEGVAPPSQTLEIRGVLRDVRLVCGGQVILLLLQPGGRPGPHAQAVFTLPSSRQHEESEQCGRIAGSW